jgi:hypothetical protein
LSEAAAGGPPVDQTLSAAAKYVASKYEREEVMKIDAACNKIADLHMAHEDDLKRAIIEVDIEVDSLLIQFLLGVD